MSSGRHILTEVKNMPKSKVMELLRIRSGKKDDKDTKGDIKQKDFIQGKISSMVDMIQNELLFGGKYDHKELVFHTHFLLVYNGKNDVPVSDVRSFMPKKREVRKDGKMKQSRAARNVVGSKKGNRQYIR